MTRHTSIGILFLAAIAALGFGSRALDRRATLAAAGTAVMAPRFSATTETVDISNRIPRAVQRAVVEMGYEVKRSPMSFPFAAPHGITMWDGVLEGGADPQRDGYVGVIA